MPSNEDMRDFREQELNGSRGYSLQETVGSIQMCGTPIGRLIKNVVAVCEINGHKVTIDVGEFNPPLINSPRVNITVESPEPKIKSIAFRQS